MAEPHSSQNHRRYHGPPQMTVRGWLHKMKLRYLPGAGDPHVVKLMGKKGMGSAHAVLMAAFDKSTFGQYSVQLRVDELAEATGWSRRTITRKLTGLEMLRVLDRAPSGPHPWVATFNLRAIEAAAEEHPGRTAEARQAERERLAREKSNSLKRATTRRQVKLGLCEGDEECSLGADEGTEDQEQYTPPEQLQEETAADTSVRPGASSPSGQAGQACGSSPRDARPSRQERRRTERLTPTVKTPPPLLALLWNLNPTRPLGAPEAGPGWRWASDLLDSEPADVWQDMIYYTTAMARGSVHYPPSPVTLGGFTAQIHEVRQARLSPTMPQPALRRWGRSTDVIKAIESGRRQPELGTLAEWELVRGRLTVLASWLRGLMWELCHSRDDLIYYIGELLAQGPGPPPDWLPEEFHLRWGELPLFDPR